jgi:hypothetical protein
VRYSTYLPIAHHMQKKVARIWILASASASANFGVVTEGAYELRIAGAHELRIWHQISDLSGPISLGQGQRVSASEFNNYCFESAARQTQRVSHS